jgi:uncharacterized protein
MTRKNDSADLTRRDFVRAGVAAAAVAGLPLAARANQPKEGDEKEPKKGKDDKKGKDEKGLVPTRALGKTGVQVSMLSLGTARGVEERTLNAAWEAGIRYIDTAAGYSNGEAEKIIAKWMKKKENRKELFIVTKDHPRSPDQWAEQLEKRLESLQIDSVDAFFIHMLGGGGRQGGGGDSTGWPKDKEWAKAVERMKKGGKVKFVGFSTHAEVPQRTTCLENAAEGGWVDAILTSYDPLVVREEKEFSKAMDKCHKAGIGLISMKQLRGAAIKEPGKLLPKFEEMGLTAGQAVLQAIWSDERIVSICSDMPSINLVKENTDAAKKYKPLDKTKLGAVLELYRREGRTFCNACDGSCRRAAGTKAALNDIVRCLSYYEMDGRREDARRMFAELTPEERDWAGADLEAASRACKSKLDFVALLGRAGRKLV